VLLRKREGIDIAEGVAPRNKFLGCMVPYTPFHHILLDELKFPVVATSANLSDDPIVKDPQEALERLSGIADAYLVHDRPIVRRVDDSVARVVQGRELILRRARGYAPLPVHVKTQERLPPVLALGGHLKNTIAIAVRDQVFVSQHIGDLDTKEAHASFRTAIEDFKRLYDFSPEIVAHDLHPDYLSTKFAEELNVPVKMGIQHHHAHIASCMAENELDGKVLGVSFDGIGYGPDGTAWGGEFLICTYRDFERTATFRSFRLPGGETAVKEPRRTALGLLFELFDKDLSRAESLPSLTAFEQTELDLLVQALKKGVRSPLTTSSGRLFDAVASLLDIRQKMSYEGQAALELEMAVDENETGTYPFEIREGNPAVVDWGPMFEVILQEVRRSTDRDSLASRVSSRFHNTLAQIILGIAERAGFERVVMSGGVFQNRTLVETAVPLLQRAGFRVFTHQRIPPNDGGISLGQAMVAAARFSATDSPT
jgi:hydrogenase maturation protein HypF